MDLLDDSTIDCILTDPPYLTTDLQFDRDGIDIEGLCNNILRVLKPNGYFISFGGIELLGQLCQYFPVRWTGVWIKPNGVMRSSVAKKPRSQSELYAVMAHPKYKVSDLTYNKMYLEGEPYRSVQRKQEIKRGGKDCLSRINTSAWGKDGYVIENNGTREQTDVIYAPNKQSMVLTERTDHPTQKPLSLLKTLLYMCTNEKDLVLDPFCGSGSTAIACHEMNRSCITIEKDNNYYLIARKRISQAMEQQRLAL
ncbi:adenine-specific methyltransferase (plasmid) [Geminocystis sp. NIES-3709]|nr:adenine-specific methyltransferase [Geminocystis sp. NIES-3709]